MDGMRVIDKGVTADDWVVIDGLQRAIPGAKVSPKRAEQTATGEPAKAPAADAPKKP